VTSKVIQLKKEVVEHLTNEQRQIAISMAPSNDELGDKILQGPYEHRTHRTCCNFMRIILLKQKKGQHGTRTHAPVCERLRIYSKSRAARAIKHTLSMHTSIFIHSLKLFIRYASKA
jgi:hypothetical protein